MSQEYSDGDVVEFGGVGQPEFVIETWLNLPQECPEELWLVTSLDRAS